MMSSPLRHAPDVVPPQSAPSAPGHARPQLLPVDAAPRPDALYEEVRLARLATEVLRQIVADQTPPTPVLARYLGMPVDDVLCCAEGVKRLPADARRMLARVALAFSPAGVRHTAQRLLEGDAARAAR